MEEVDEHQKALRKSRLDAAKEESLKRRKKSKDFKELEKQKSQSSKELAQKRSEVQKQKQERREQESRHQSEVAKQKIHRNAQNVKSAAKGAWRLGKTIIKSIKNRRNNP